MTEEELIKIERGYTPDELVEVGYWVEETR